MSVYIRTSSILTHGHVSVPSTAALRVVPWSIAAWVYHEGGASARNVYLGTGIGQAALVYGDGNSNFWASAYGMTLAERAVDPGTAILNEWLFYVATYDNTNLRLYRGYDGTFELRATVAATQPATPPAAGSVLMGTNLTDTRGGLDGNLAEIAFFDSALDLSAGAALYAARTGGYAEAVLAQGPVAYWRLRDAFPSSTAVDEQGIVNGSYLHVEYNSDPFDYDYRLLGSEGPVADRREGWGMLI